MKLKWNCALAVWPGVSKILMVMKLIVVFMVLALAQVSAKTYGQNVTLHQKNTTLKKVLILIEKQTGYQFIYDSKLEGLKTRTLNIDVDNQSIDKVLDQCFSNLPINYIIVQKTVALKRKDIEKNSERSIKSSEVHKVKGIVTDDKGNVLPGVSIKVETTNVGTVTNFKGEYEINVEEGATLLFSYIGFASQKIAVSGKTRIDVVMQIDEIASKLQEVVVVGYGTQKKVNLTGSVSSISANELESRPITQASQALAGLATGVTVSQGSGRPGNDGSSITVRGLGTFSNAGTDALVLVDGLASSINDVDPNNIKSISVLKDAASASIYGTRAANGVILIETKRGQAGKLQINYNNYAGWQKVTELPQFLDSWEYAELRGGYTAEQIALYKSGSDPDNYPNVPHLKKLLNSGSGFQTNHSLNFMGGNENNSYLFSLGYLKQDGIVAENTYDKYNFLLNYDSKLKKNLSLKFNLSGFSAGTNEPRHSSGDMTNMIAFAVREPAIFAGAKSDGTYGYQDNFSPEAWLASESFINRKNKNFLGGVELSWEIVKGLSLSGKGGYRYFNYTDNDFISEVVFDKNKTVGPNRLSIGTGDNSLLTLQSLLQYSKAIKQHSFNVLAGYSQEEYQQDWMSASRDRFANNSLYELNAGAASNMQSSGSGTEWALRSYFGRVNYSFAGKYLLEANARYDGTSRFPKKGRWGFFPSVSAGWRISEESFIKDNLSWIDNLKLRASWGQLGNQNISDYPYQNVLALGQNYTFGGTLAPGAKVNRLANADVTWETTQITDIGLDLGILNGKLDVTLDFFDKTTSDILYPISVSSVLGLATSDVNAGEVKNTGFELMFNYKTSIGKLNIGLAPNFSYIKNRVTKLADGKMRDIGKGLFVGESLRPIYGYVADGLFVDAADVASYPTQPIAGQPGVIRFKDISGPDGVPDGKVDATYDRKVLASTFPKYSYGATVNADYKGFDFSLLLQGLAGLEKQMGNYQAFAFYNGGNIQRWQADNAWTEANPNPNALYPKLTSLGLGSQNVQTSTFWNRNASFLRVKNVQVGYTLPKSAIQKLSISQLRLFFGGQNLFSANHFYTGWDPEMSQGGGDQRGGDNTPFYPITSVYTFGMNVKF